MIWHRTGVALSVDCNVCVGTVNMNYYQILLTTQQSRRGA